MMEITTTDIRNRMKEILRELQAGRRLTLTRLGRPIGILCPPAEVQQQKKKAKESR